MMLEAMEGPFDLLRHGPWLVFAFCFGACIGSFLNVVVYRLPRGISLVNPPSSCPHCGARLRFFRENLPVFGWVLLRGKCRWCRASISPVYPIVELTVAVLLVGLYAVLFMTTDRDGWWFQVAGPWWGKQGFAMAWPAYSAIAVLLAALWATTVIDAKTFLIPIQIPVFASIAGMMLWTIEGGIARNLGTLWPLPGADWSMTLAGGLGLAGVLGATALLWMGRFKPSFADYEEYVPEGETLGDYPHARREMGRELLFLVPCIAGILIGWWWGSTLQGAPPRWIQALGTCMFGYIVGGGLVWSVRILGTLGFGREAMGLGDVHLLAAVGAVLGWFVPVIAFFIAPFLGLAWAAGTAIWGRVGGTRRELPYGPHLAVAVVAVFLCRPLVLAGLEAILPTVDPPARGLVPAVGDQTQPSAIDALSDAVGGSGGQWTMNTVQCRQPGMDIGLRDGSL